MRFLMVVAIASIGFMPIFANAFPLCSKAKLKTTEESISYTPFWSGFNHPKFSILKRSNPVIACHATNSNGSQSCDTNCTPGQTASCQNATGDGTPTCSCSG